ncbi:Mak10 subunit, NatC N-terminal acetyltransferase-domain-containing protein [Crucibulum laeve]|uniref:Mak10 subunit, NatC N-terminal acetyltransferase-domain-containing protein n=1 Tax=Crucibulum laeve TaxID=68775 RepID=A0A5C3LIC0_9AGAR|nr:Mak10 subunit, NatC N-terminal acetyltransferase-domain-containing protein [Crucibulum laeve]
MDVYTSNNQLPGGRLEYNDVTALFEDAAADMEPEDMIFMDGFTLQDAMSAFEIGEPRLDSGLILENQRRPPFNPLNPLLPEELCWIIDRSFAYEMEWHAGNFLQHTVFTLLYMHHLHDIEPDFIPLSSRDHPSRPLELITVVLRAAVQGLLKCCDLGWRELGKGSIQDAEDWQSDKCDVSLLEGVPVKFVVAKLDEAVNWLCNSGKVSNPWRDALCERLLLRRSLLQLMNTDVSRDRSVFQTHIIASCEYLRSIAAHSSPNYEPGTTPHFAFDPYIARRLNTFVPIRVLDVPPVQQTWKAIGEMLDGFWEVSLLANNECLATWQAVGNLRVWMSEPALRSPYIRSLTQSTFYDGLLILNKYTYAWMVDRFFLETLGVTYDTIVKTINERWTGSSVAPLTKIERTMYKLISPHIRSMWYNPPRRRRHLMKSLADWHSVYDQLTEIVESLNMQDLPSNHFILHAPKVPLLWRLSCIQEIIFSGFQLELYTSDERPFAYWYATHIINSQLECFDDMMHEVPKNSPALHEMQYQCTLLTALQAMLSALFIVTLPLMSFDWNRIRPSFYRRYKWAFRPEYDNIGMPPVAHPELSTFMQACSDVLKHEDELCPADSIYLAHSLISKLVHSENVGGWAADWGKERLQFTRYLLDACDRLQNLPASAEAIESFDASLLKWDPRIHPWFPTLLSVDKKDSELERSNAQLRSIEE